MAILTARRIVFWGAFAAFVVIALFHYSEKLTLDFNNDAWPAHIAVIAVWLGFTAYSLYCIPRESLWESAQRILGLWWGRQVTADLYISVFLSIGLVWLVTGSVAETLLWSVAIIPFANLAILLFVILHFYEIVEALTAF